jgi:hypothetical protein
MRRRWYWVLSCLPLLACGGEETIDDTNGPAVTTRGPNATGETERQTSSVRLPHQCMIAQGICVKHPSYVGTFPDPWYQGGEINSCLLRAADFSLWCGNPPGLRTTATWVGPPPAAPVSKTYIAGNSCVVTLHGPCHANPNLAPLIPFHDRWGYVYLKPSTDVSIQQCAKRAQAYRIWCGGQIIAQTRFYQLGLLQGTFTSTPLLPPK